ncbi:putative F-box domain, FBD domain, leucine-rich repeat domain superfamily [Helianthus annuus]|uniref:F-box domain, FBD domain, leucine-rich repeat domain superfamily n=2 Tax=Helianthus annuus TaxID=4232 RepID=A0A9K3DKJ2_HELAN|nr:putative F-box/FBD/LRR-repeat protein At5g22670 [Helianthus annuus]KAF5757154.1 putative F-box domain, FBD domain, leucine-rich repeat domain superfamily [Helianthus annuus]KAJ0430573.1 putative F-box domain, FBD domain, leucine-rich repeat domain superfamily [Helianthus annuus]KAJ0633885.1 putative F-box domain, FBD domain, leucine-rich repeat domain superfamily [Helianthus annuus]
MSSISEDVDDRLSGLPEDTISHILSLMPTKFAVRTSILAKRWRYSWMGVTNLDFDDIHPFYDKEILSKFVDRVMENCKSSQLGLLRLPFSNKQVKRESVSSWIDKAVRLNVSEIDMQVHSFELPISLFTCKTLTKLRINPGNPTYRVWECPCPVNLPCLKTLDIAVRHNPFVNVFELIRGCPILESLSLEVFIQMEEEEDYIFNIPTLKRLKLIVQKVYSSVTKKVVLNVPNLDYLFVGGMLGSLFVMEDLSSLVEASTSFRCLWSDGMWLEFLKGISGVKSLSIKKFPFNSALPIFPHVRHLQLTSLWYSRLVLEFLESCPELKHLYIEELTNERWIKPKLIPACLLTNLTTIKISSCKGGRPEIKFLEYMLGNAKVLKTVTITCEIYPIKEENWLRAKLLKLSRVSRYCEIRFVK